MPTGICLILLTVDFTYHVIVVSLNFASPGDDSFSEVVLEVLLDVFTERAKPRVYSSPFSLILELIRGWHGVHSLVVLWSG